MLKSIYLFLILTHAVLQIYAAQEDNENSNVTTPTTNSVNATARQQKRGNIADCLTNSLDQSLYCRGARAIRNVFNNLNKSDKPIVIVRGLEIVRSSDSQRNASTTASASHSDYSNAIDVDDDGESSFLGKFSEYLRTHELNIKFSDLLAEESEQFAARDLAGNGFENNNIEEARKKDKGQGILMAMALMFGKMMAVMGLGGIGALAMKALGVAMAALMMAGIVGLKSLSEKGGGHESSHSVQYLAPDAHHHRRRRRRSLDLMRELYEKKLVEQNEPYRGWLRGSN